MRQAALRLAIDNASVRSLLNPRQSQPVEYTHSALNLNNRLIGNVRVGQPAPDAWLAGKDSKQHLSQYFGHSFVLLHFGVASALNHCEVNKQGVGSVRVVDIGSNQTQARERYGAVGEHSHMVVLVRPDGYMMAVWQDGAQVDMAAALKKLW